MILYFSGTGNSQWVALRLAEALDDDVVSLNDLLKEGRVAPIRSERPLVFVAPVYAWRLPQVIDRWIRAAHFEGNRAAYFVMTCGGKCGNSAAYARRLCEATQLSYRGLAGVVMPKNYVVLNDTPSNEACESLLERAEPRLWQLAAQIEAGEQFAEVPVTWKDRLRSGPANTVFYAALVRDKAFAVTDACASCGACARRCPLNNITLSDGRPVWHGSCTHCMACIGGCPTGAIEYSAKTKGRHRYYLKDADRT